MGIFLDSSPENMALKSSLVAELEKENLGVLSKHYQPRGSSHCGRVKVARKEK